ncbi:hypothetical protein GCM10023090_22820 [Acidovorax lacteus]|uniref:PilY1 beta-propeller domain-containing protein n=2 Tax=Acidovorax lacteus TaxID=1924988 RepID=A0ABP8LDX4_9BURK
MLAASKDHSLFGPMYTDFEDLDNDGVIDTTYKPDFKYYGYFDATKCYTYSSTDGRFNPAASATISGGRFVCGGTGHWSGNFLNWSTMSRLDIVRKMLYGGFRSIDNNGTTELMGSRFVQDAHSFVKYYKGTDIRDYTPFTQADLTKTTGANANVYAGLSLCVTGSSEDPKTSQPTIRLVKGNVRFWSTVEIKLCRWRDAPDNYDQGTFGPKLARFYFDADKGNGGVRHEISIPSRTQDGATYSGIGPDLNLKVRVCDPSLLGDERCQPFPATSTTNFKPYGLLQEFGYAKDTSTLAKTEFGLITGSYDRKNTAGALRKNIRDLEDEINRTTGVFCHSPSSGCAATLADGRATGNGIIKSFDSMILFGRSGTSYGGAAAPSGSGETDLPAWGNPMGEMLVQALQYYAFDGSTPSPTNPSSSTNDANAGLPVATWQDPLASSTARAPFGNAMCRPLNILALSSSALSFDGQAGTPFTTLPSSSAGLDSFVNQIGAAEGIHNTIRSVGSVSGKGLTAADDKNSCSAKTVTSLADVNGICPEAPAMGGTYQIAGAALYGNTTRIRTPSTPPPDLNKVEGALKVKTMAASLTGGAPRIDVPVPGSNPKKFVYITPESVQNGGNVSAPLTFASVSSGPTYGAFIVTWNDRLMGGDYDMDITGFLRYDLIANSSSPSGWDIRITTDIPNVCGGAAGTHGFSIVGVTRGGTSADGRYLTHQHGGSNSNYVALTGMPGTTEHLCGDATYRARIFSGARTFGETVCAVTGDGNTGDPNNATKPRYCTVKNEDFLVTNTFNMVGESDALIKEPLWYAGKYGYFKSSVKNADGTYSNVSMPSSQLDWDNYRSDGSIGQDGIPDGYFAARRPELLEQRLRDALEQIINTTNSAPAVSSAQVITGGYKYVASFEPAQNAGSLLGYQLLSNGAFSATPSWDAGQKLAATSTTSRPVITNDGVTGVAFSTATTFSTAYMAALRGSGAGALTTTQADELINYLRGDRSREKPTGIWRTRRVSNILGSIVNSSPWLQLRPSAKNIGALPANTPTYASFANANKARSRPLWVGSNDGMLHAFQSEGSNAGEPILSYLPSPIVGRARVLSQDMTAIQAGMDGSPFTGDVLLGTGGVTSSWKTYLFSSLGRGGRAFFALDVTDPSALTQSNAASIYKWMFSSDDDADMGYVLGDPKMHPQSNQAIPIARMNNGKYAVLMPNGVGSVNGRSFLYILFVDGPSGSNGTWVSGTDYVKIATDTVGGGGLMGVNWADLDGNGTADVVYGTDLQGRLWKFDVRAAATASWGSAYTVPSTTTPAPMFEAKSGTQALSISAAPALSFPDFGGVMIAFGTGKSINAGDFPDATKTQRFYSIYDKANWATASPVNSNLSTLLQRTLVRTSDGSVYVSVGATAFNKDTHDGWYFNFVPLSSSTSLNNEMVLTTAENRFGTLFFTSVRPSAASSNSCFSAPDGALYALDPVSGTPRSSILGTVDVVVGSVTVKVNKVGQNVADQKVVPGLKVLGNGKKGTITAIGQNTDASLAEVWRAVRRQWREVPNTRTFD